MRRAPLTRLGRAALAGGAGLALLAMPLGGLLSAQGPAQAQGVLGPSAATAPPPRPATVTQGALSAAEALRGAIAALERAGSGREQVAALSQTIRAYEAGMAELRGGLRRASLREAEIRKQFNDKRDRLSGMLAAMMEIGDSPAPATLLHPAGPEAAVRAGLLLSEVTPALQFEASGLARDLDEIGQIRALQEGALGLLDAGLAAAQAARANLSQAMADRSQLPRRFLEDPEELRALVQSAATLDSLSDGIAVMEKDIGAPMEDFESAKGSLALPVLGTILRRPGEADAAGIRRPGLLLATRPAALVTTPWPATVRYRGPFLDYGNVMILEPANGYLLVLAGLGSVYGQTGDVLEAGAPVGLMGGAEPGGREFLEAVEKGGGADRTETLYIELRDGRTPLDPAEWFADTAETKDD